MLMRLGNTLKRALGNTRPKKPRLVVLLKGRRSVEVCQRKKREVQRRLATELLRSDSGCVSRARRRQLPLEEDIYHRLVHQLPFLYRLTSKRRHQMRPRRRNEETIRTHTRRVIWR
jgi:hypothetical protein